MTVRVIQSILSTVSDTEHTEGCASDTDDCESDTEHTDDW